MSWQTEITPIVRILIDDYAEPYTYTDSRLEEIIVIAAQMLITSIDWDKTYTISIPDVSISPDPTANTKDNAFINLTSLKAACFILMSEAKTASRQGIKISDGPSSIDTTGRLQSALKTADTMCKNFDMAKLEYMAGNSRAGEAVLTPYTREDLPPGDNFK